MEKNRSLKSTYISTGTIIDAREDRPSQVEPIVFASGPVLVLSGETDSVTKPPHTITYVTFDQILEPGAAGMGAGKILNEGHASDLLTA